MAANKGHFVLAATSNYLLRGALSNDLVIATGNSNQSIVFGSSNGSNMYFKISSNGYVGVGKSNPGYTLDILGNVNFVGALTSNGVPFVSGGGFSNNSSNLFVLAPSNIGIHVATPLAPFHVGSNMRVDGSMTFFNPIQFGGLDITPGATVTNASQLVLATSNIQGYSNNIWGAASNGTQFSIMSNSVNDSWRWLSGASSNEVMRLTGAGALGIGASAPASILHLGSNGAANVMVTLCNSTTGSSPAYIGLSNSGEAVVATRSNSGIVFLASNVEVMRVSSNGLLGIGTAAPASILHLGSNAAANVMVTMCNATTGGSPAYLGLSNSGDAVVATRSNSGIIFLTSNVERMRVSSNGLVGIGTSAPGAYLNIDNSAGHRSSSFYIKTGQAGIYLDSSAYSTYGTGGHKWNVWSSVSSEVIGAGHLAVFDETAGAYRMLISATGNVGIGTTSPAYALDVTGTIHATQLVRVDGSLGANAITIGGNGVLSIDAAGVPGGRFIVKDSAGSSYVGIGTGSPGYTLDVAGTINSAAGFRISACNNYMLDNYFGVNDRYGLHMKSGIMRMYTAANYAPSALALSLATGIDTFTDLLYINHSGQVGIGTASPGVPLDVIGQIRSYGNGGQGSSSINTGNTGNVPGFLAFFAQNGTRLGYVGWAGTNASYIGLQSESTMLGYQVSGNLIVNGSLAKGSGSFDIPHPVLPGKRLLHSFIEGPRADLIYRGKAVLVGGRATVNLNRECTGNGSVMTDGTFEALCRDPEVFLQNNETWDRVRGSVEGCTLTIECENAAADCTIAWMVVAERKDPTMVQWDKTDADGRMVLEHDAVEGGVPPPA